MVLEDRSSLENHAPPEFYIATLNRQIRTLMEKTLRPLGLTLVEWRLLQCLENGQVKTICELSMLAVIERTVTGRLVDKLVARGLIAKEPLGTDRRVSQITLNPPGQDLLTACAENVATARSKLFRGLGQLELGQLLSLLKTLQQNAFAACEQNKPATAEKDARDHKSTSAQPGG